MENQLRMFLVSVLSPVVAFFTPTTSFLYALAIMFAFNIWCGMRADGVVLVRYKKFSTRKFKNALIELFLYLLIIEVVFAVMVMMDDKKEAIIVVKSISYVFMYVYLQNGFKNLIMAYPRNKGFRIVYHVIRLEFKRAMSSQVQEIIDKLEKEEGITEKKENHD